MILSLLTGTLLQIIVDDKSDLKQYFILRYCSIVAVFHMAVTRDGERIKFVLHIHVTL